MKIGIISPMYPYKGSSECVFVEALVNEFVKFGHHCTVIAPFSLVTYWSGKRSYGPEYEKRFIDDNLFVEIYKPRFFGIKDIPIMGISNSSFSARKAIERVIRKNNLTFDVIYCHFFAQGIRAFKYAKTNNIPLFVATGESTIQKLNKPSFDFDFTEFKEYLKGTICVSTKNKVECVQLGYSIESKCKVIPNAVDLGLFHKPCDRDDIRKKLGIKKSDVVIACVGEFCERKGQNRVVEAVKILENPDIKIMFIGRSLQKYIVESIPNIILQQSVSHDNLPYYLHAADFFVLPTRKEGCCNAIVEAMACGLPIVSSDKPFNKDILNDKNSIMVDPDDVNAISSAISQLFENEERRKLMGEVALSDAMQLSIEKRARIIEEYIINSL